MKISIHIVVELDLGTIADVINLITAIVGLIAATLILIASR